MRCVITGANGFLGQVLIKKLLANGHSCLGLVRSKASMSVVTALGADAEIADLFDQNKLAQTLNNYQPTTVFHLAAEIATQRDRNLIYRVNVEGTKILAETCRPLKLTAFVFASTVVVGDPQGNLIDETTPLIATTTYGQSKQAAEALLLNEMKTNNLPVIILRPSHIYGYGGWYEELVTEMLKGRFMIPGNGKNWWDVVHVDDVAEAFRIAAEKPMPGEVFHIVDDQPILMDDFFGETAQALQLSKPWHVPQFIASLVRGRDPVSAAVRSAKSSNRKLKERLGWQPQFPDANVGIKDCIAKLKVNRSA